MTPPVQPRIQWLASRSRRERGLMALDAVPPILRPMLRAYLLGYLSAVAPRLLTLLLQRFTRRRKGEPRLSENPPRASFLESVGEVLRRGLDWQRFPTFCAVLVGGSTLLEVRNFRSTTLLSVPRRPGPTLGFVGRAESWLTLFSRNLYDGFLT